MTDPTRTDANRTEYTRHVEGQSRLGRAFRTMPRWKGLLMVAAVVVGIVGVGGQLTAKALRQSTPPVQTTVTRVTPAPSAPAAGAPAGANGFVSGADAGGPSGPTQTTTTTTETPAPAGPKTLTDSVTPYMTGVGLSFAVGLVVGLIFRTFLGLAATLTAVVVAGGLALSYFGVLPNVDLSGVRTQAGQATSFLAEQGGHLKDLIFAHLPSSGGAAAGFLVGMKRR